jgi:hypothetical protein
MRMPEGESREVSIELFGGPRVRTGDAEPILLQEKPGALLTLLVLRPGKRCTREEITEILWPDVPQDTALKRLRTTLYALRKPVPRSERYIIADRESIALRNGGEVWVDADEFDRLFAELKHATDRDKQIDVLARLDSLYRGPFCPRIYIDEAVRARDLYEIRIAEVRKRLHEVEEAREATRTITLLSRSAEGAGPSEEITAPAHPAAVATVGRAAVSVRRRGWLLTGFAACLLLIAIFLAVGQPHLSTRDRIAKLQSLRTRPTGGEPEEARRKRMEARADHLLALAEEGSPAWYGPEEDAWIRRFSDLDGDIRDCLDWLTGADPEKAVLLTGALSRYWSYRRESEKPLEVLSAALPRVRQKETPQFARALALHAMCSMVSDDMRSEFAQRRNREGLGEIREANAIYARLHDEIGLAQTTRCEGHFLHTFYQEDSAQASFERALVGFKRLGDQAGQAHTYWGLSLLNPGHADDDTHCLRSLWYSMQSVITWRKCKCRRELTDARVEAGPFVNWALVRPSLRSHPKAILLLKSYADECQAELADPASGEEPADTLVLRKMLARTAMRLGEQPTAVEQLGHVLISTGDASFQPAPGYIDALEAYIRNINRTDHPPLTLYLAKRHLAFDLNHAHVHRVFSHPLSLEEAVEIACR